MTTSFVTNRREVKYLVSTDEAEEFKSRMVNLLVQDTHNDGSGYLNHSIYFDSPDLKFFRQKIKGKPTRSKPRLRTYRPSPHSPPSAIFLEFKHRDSDIVAKERTELTASQAERLLRGEPITSFNDAIIKKFAALRDSMKLMNCVSILYHRNAFSCANQPGLRNTFDSRIQYSVSFDLTPPLDTLKPLEPVDRAVIELKFSSPLPVSITNTAAYLGFQPSTYSKYSEGVQRAHLNGLPLTP